MADASVLWTLAQVWRVIVAEARLGQLAFHTGATLSRVQAAFCSATDPGNGLGLVLVLYPRLDRWRVIFLNMPAMGVIVLAYLWLDLNEVAVSINKTAMVIVTVHEGVRARDRRIAEMARVYRRGLPICRCSNRRRSCRWRSGTGVR